MWEGDGLWVSLTPLYSHLSLSSRGQTARPLSAYASVVEGGSDLSPLLTLLLNLFSLSCKSSSVVKGRKITGSSCRMKSAAKDLESFVAGWDTWLVNSMCLAASFLWSRLCDLLRYRRRRRASASPAIQVRTRLFDLLNHKRKLAEEHSRVVFGWSNILTNSVVMVVLI